MRRGLIGQRHVDISVIVAPRLLFVALTAGVAAPIVITAV